jgi:hypothetical protein
MYSLVELYNVNTRFLQTSTARHLKTCPDRKKLTTYLNSAQKILLRLPTVVRAEKKEKKVILLSSVIV